MLQQLLAVWEAVRIVIFKLFNDLLDFCAVEKLNRVSKTGKVESVSAQVIRLKG
jgi:DNA-binding FrmR family transcriptional regulator